MYYIISCNFYKYNKNIVNEFLMELSLKMISFINIIINNLNTYNSH